MTLYKNNKFLETANREKLAYIDEKNVKKIIHF